ncbi:alpha-ketoacid dehydrogenase subunit beta [Candidatus Woesearchaeota archaeon]|nr:MAG: alpha-ketoacid dehydrogenase subunit beta [Candidatus Woesearchaeota archaeon]
MTVMNMVEALNDALRIAMKEDERVMILGEDVGKEGGVFRVTSGLQQEFGEERAVDTPLSEGGIFGTSIGLAIGGMIPVCEAQFSGFIYPGFDQLISHAARMRTRSRGKYAVPLVLRSPCSGGIRALEHHSESMEAIYAHTPGLKVVMPSGPYDAKGLLLAAIKDPDPVIFLEPKRVYRAIKEEVPQEAYEIELGKANIVNEGSDLTLVTWGAMLRDVKKALEESEYSAEIIDLRTISPLDTQTIIDSVNKTGRLVIVQEAPRECSVSSEIAAQVVQKALTSLLAPIERVTGFDTIFPLYQNELLYLPSKERILKAIDKVMHFD